MSHTHFNMAYVMSVTSTARRGRRGIWTVLNIVPSTVQQSSPRKKRTAP